VDTQLDTRIKRALEERKGDWQTVALGSGVSYSWLSKFVNGHIDNPGYGTLLRLATYLGLSDPATARHVGDDPRDPSPALDAAGRLTGERRDEMTKPVVFNKAREADRPNAGQTER
jgi:transcriptional regulator with XRE-family HTH domain